MNSQEQHSLQVLSESLEDIREMAAGLHAATEKLQASVNDVKACLAELTRECLSVHALLETWCPSPESTRGGRNVSRGRACHV